MGTSMPSGLRQARMPCSGRWVGVKGSVDTWVSGDESATFATKGGGADDIPTAAMVASERMPCLLDVCSNVALGDNIDRRNGWLLKVK